MTIDSIVGDDGINLSHPVVKLFRKLMLQEEAKKQNSDIYCPNCKTNLPHRPPFVAWDNEKAKPSYFCTLCQKEFYDLNSMT